ncbi:MAG TPA: enoyl-CoA hydratase-related protein [Planctomycetota bacterium]|jgi:enoyl-CoA hydratase|nr:crotonase [Planctomycetota bacterium]MDP7245228.1 enoyl-CoA hydratase-related protein [Planctomycetota bacterium]HJM39051.1 enoyl-CoA hydratase-related protein [Planctomycetota bacterium]|tara:strand:- start:20118 stop:20924 length:807 start_codon:yes stop_codon:yes gene_type:complete
MTEEIEQELIEENEVVSLEILDDGVARLTIERESALNALNVETLLSLRDAIIDCAESEDVKVVILTGSGDKAFVAGADIAEMKDMTPLEARDFSHLGQDTFATIEACPKPVIAMVNGFALGGGLELAMACHLRVASSKAKLGLPETSLGLIPGFGGTQRLAQLAGAGVAREWILSADMFSAEEAHRVGVVNRLADPENLEAETFELARTLSSRGALAMKTANEVVRLGLEVGQSEGEASESDNFALLFSNEEAREGLKAFTEKRKPNW